MKVLLLPLLLSTLLPGAALADDAAMRHCRTLADSSARVQCYDAIALAPATSAPGIAAAQAATGAAPAPRLATSVKPADPQEAERNFGLAPAALQRPREPEAAQSISSSIVGNFDGWLPNQQIKLANGQVWRVVDGSEGVLPRAGTNVQVKVVRGLLGALFMEIDGSNQTPKVRRVN